jgi:hypothetical protein
MKLLCVKCGNYLESNENYTFKNGIVYTYHLFQTSKMGLRYLDLMFFCQVGTKFLNTINKIQASNGYVS